MFQICISWGHINDDDAHGLPSSPLRPPPQGPPRLSAGLHSLLGLGQQQVSLGLSPALPGQRGPREAWAGQEADLQVSDNLSSALLTPLLMLKLPLLQTPSLSFTGPALWEVWVGDTESRQRQHGLLQPRCPDLRPAPAAGQEALLLRE